MVTIRKPKNALKFSHPAGWWGSTWREALPLGNGVIGASVYGGAGNDVVLINHSDLWWQGHVGVLRDVADNLKDVRKKMEDGQAKEAENILGDSLIKNGYRPQLSYPLPLCDFKIKMQIDRTPKEYSRVLNMETGEMSVSFKDGATKYDRSMFVSRAQDLIVYEITKTGSKSIEVDFSFDIHDRFNNRTPSAVSKLPDGINVKYENFFMYFSARSDNGTEFGAVGFINYYGGSQTVGQNGIHIKGADKVLVVIRPFVESQREKEWKALKTSLTAIKSTYEKLLKEHSALHSKLFNSAELDLDATDRDNYVENLLDNSFVGGDLSLALIEKLWAYGRYLMISGTSPNSAPLAPYGLWCGDYKAEKSQIDASGPLQTIYAHVMSGNLSEFMNAVFTYYESVIDDLRKNASRLYACRGLFIPSIMAHGTGVLGSVESKIIHFTGVAGWVAQLFFDYYLYTDDTKFLKARALPFMREVAMFYEEFFKLDTNNVYESVPSYSPNTSPYNFTNNGVDKMEIARNSTIDFAVAKELLNNLVYGAELCGVYKNELAKWKDMLTRIPNYEFNGDGTVREYIDSKFSDNYSSASTALYYPVFPGTEFKTGCEENKAFLNTAKKKVSTSEEDQTSASLVCYANIFARCGDGNSAMEIMNSVVRMMAMNNLMIASSDWRGMGVACTDKWATYSVEPNMGITSLIQEMLIQSDKDSITLLPALPDALSKGEIDGIATRAGVEIVSLSWDKKKNIVLAKVKSKKSNKITLKLPLGAKKFKPIGGEKFDLETSTVTNLELPAGKVIALDIRL